LKKLRNTKATENSTEREAKKHEKVMKKHEKNTKKTWKKHENLSKKYWKSGETRIPEKYRFFCGILTPKAYRNTSEMKKRAVGPISPFFERNLAKKH